MRYVSLFDGLGAAHLAAGGLGWECVAVSEIEGQAHAVVSHHYPGMRNLGDVTTAEWGGLGAVDLVCGGSPCQSFSVAGKRLGLDDPRGNLALHMLRVARELRASWVVFENVPGLLSSGGGRDFGAFLGLLAECGYGWAYRVLDAQHFGVPQRRRRVFVVGHLGDWRPAAAVLFERESLSGHPAPRREAGEDVAGTVAASAPSRRNGGSDPVAGQFVAGAFIPSITGPVTSCGGTERKHGHGWGQQEAENGFVIAHSLRADGFDASEDGTGRGTPLIVAGTLGAHHGNIRADDAWKGNLVSAKWQPNGSQMAASVRRLTPRECERLQGFPDDWTLVPWKGKPMADGPRYRMIGNSWAVSVVRWIFERLHRVNESLGR